MRLDKFTIKAQEALENAQLIADEKGNQQIEPEHLLLALLCQEDGIVQPLLQKLGAAPEALARQVENELSKLPVVTGAVTIQAYLSPRLKSVLGVAWNEAQRLKDEYVSVEHLLIAIASEIDSVAGGILRSYGVGKDEIYKALQDDIVLFWYNRTDVSRDGKSWTSY
ncbi:MAG: Clp protease N-terminal domain-containing protein [Armatimonadota bacterium]|nr:Clp protease N-terminal domain-containing protein [Armatimonadota bacterium]